MIVLFSAIVSLSILLIICSTLFFRCPSVAHTIQHNPLWSYTEVFSGQRSSKGILLNIALFIQLGWFLAAVPSRKRYIAFLLPIFLSITIELIQYYTGRGTADIDDVISNGIGGAIGVIVFLICKKLCRDGRKQLIIPIVTILFLAAECIGAYETYSSSHLNSRLREYDFVIEDVELDEDNFTIRGRCSVYDRETPAYLLILSDIQAIPLETVIDGENFIATGETDGGKKHEVLIHFTRHETMSTGTWIYGTAVEFIAGKLPVVDGVPDDAVLKAYDAESDTLVFQDGDRLIWLIGKDVEPTTEIIYHIHTDEKQKLPENRKKYGFDNRGFRTGTGRELEPIGYYRVFEKEIPSEYHVAEVIVGFNSGGRITWEQNFRVDYD